MLFLGTRHTASIRGRCFQGTASSRQLFDSLVLRFGTTETGTCVSPENLCFLSSACLTLSWQKDLTNMLRKKVLGGQLRNGVSVQQCDVAVQYYWWHFKVHSNFSTHFKYIKAFYLFVCLNQMACGVWDSSIEMHLALRAQQMIFVPSGQTVYCNTFKWNCCRCSVIHDHFSWHFKQRTHHFVSVSTLMNKESGIPLPLLVVYSSVFPPFTFPYIKCKYFCFEHS